MAKIRPLEDRVVIRQLEAEEKTAGGIVLPDMAREKPQRGEVLSVGPGKLLDSGERAQIGVAEGDIVLFGKYSGAEIKIGVEEIKILRESDILAVLSSGGLPGGPTTYPPDPDLGHDIEDGEQEEEEIEEEIIEEEEADFDEDDDLDSDDGMFGEPTTGPPDPDPDDED